MKRRFYTLDEAAATINTDVATLMEAAENGAITIVVRSHSNYMVRFCVSNPEDSSEDAPEDSSEDTPQNTWNIVDCLPVPSEAIAELVAKGGSHFSRFRWPGLDDTWFLVHHRSAPSGYTETNVPVRREDLCMTADEIERIVAGRDQEPFDFIGGAVRTWENFLSLEARDIRQSLQSEDDEMPGAGDCEEAAAGIAPGACNTANPDRLNPKMRMQVDAILSAVAMLDCDRLAIPDGGRASVGKNLVSKRPDLFKTDTVFEKAWKVARGRELVRMENHEIYARSRKK